MNNKRTNKVTEEKIEKYKKTAPFFIGSGVLLIMAVCIFLVTDYQREKELLTSLTEQIENGNIPKNPTDETGRLSDHTGKKMGERIDETAGKTEKGIGILFIPKIELTVPVKEGVDKKTLRTAVGIVPGAAMPGDEMGNCSIAGHRNYSFGRFFNRLDEMEAGDLILITMTEGRTYTYEVTEILVVEPEDTTVLQSKEEPELTLITCTPTYIASHRLIVKAKLIGNKKEGTTDAFFLRFAA